MVPATVRVTFEDGALQYAVVTFIQGFPSGRGGAMLMVRLGR